MFAYAIVGALLIARSAPHVKSLSLLEGENIAYFIGGSGAIALAAGRLIVGRWLIPGRALAASGLPCGIVAFGLVYVSAAIVVSPFIYHSTFDTLQSGRLLAGCLMAVFFYPFFAAGEELGSLASSNSTTTRLGGAAQWACRLALPAATAASLPLLPYRLERFSLAVAFLALFATAFGALLSRVSRNPASGTTFASALTAWIIAVGFIRY